MLHKILNISENNYLETKKTNSFPYLPLEGKLDLTYRCNNNCLHCWLRIPPESPENKDELSFEEIRSIVDKAKAMGCRRWSVSGGEPMLRPDFAEIYGYLSRNSSSYFINTNGTLITPKIAQLMKRKSTSLVVSLYGATKDVHDQITRNLGSFEATMRGFRYLKEAGAGFIVQLIPMKDNYHQFNDMLKLAGSLSKHYRIGAAWLYLSACGDPERNRDIMRQRLLPKETAELNKFDLSYENWMDKEATPARHNTNDNGHLFSSCIAARRDFHIDSYGKMTFCYFIKDPALRYDLRRGSFKEAWEKFIPSLATKVKVTQEYKNNCGSCKLRKDCLFCPVYAYLEHRDFNKKVKYLCAVAKINRKFNENQQKSHRRYFSIADITIQVDSDVQITEATFHPKFKHFKVDGPGKDTVTISHYFSLPDLDGKDMGKEFYRRPPWAVYKKGDSWVYLGILPTRGDKSLYRVATFNSGHTRARIYSDKEETFLKGNLSSLTMFPSDEIFLARVLADREGFYLHSCGVNFNGNGLLFVGHSEAGKSTMATMLKGKAEILCDDRIIVRRQPNTAKRTPQNEFRIYGTWSHGDVPDVSSASAPLRAIMFLQKADENRLIPMLDKKEIAKRLLPCLIKPFVTVDWWEKTLSVVDKVVKEVPCYMIRFDKSGEIVGVLKQLL